MKLHYHRHNIRLLQTVTYMVVPVIKIICLSKIYSHIDLPTRCKDLLVISGSDAFICGRRCLNRFQLRNNRLQWKYKPYSKTARNYAALFVQKKVEDWKVFLPGKRFHIWYACQNVRQRSSVGQAPAGNRRVSGSILASDILLLGTWEKRLTLVF